MLPSCSHSIKGLESQTVKFAAMTAVNTVYDIGLCRRPFSILSDDDLDLASITHVWYLYIGLLYCIESTSTEKATNGPECSPPPTLTTHITERISPLYFVLFIGSQLDMLSSLRFQSLFSRPSVNWDQDT